MRKKQNKSKHVSRKPQQVTKKVTPVKKVAGNSLLNLNFYRVADGLYNSYWIGKIAAVLQHGGNKRTVLSQIHKACVALRFILQSNPLILILEMLDKVKPNFRLRNYIVRRTVIKEYPVVVLRPRQLILAVHWLKEDLRNSTALSSSLAETLTGKLCDFKLQSKKTNLVKKRNEYLKRVIKAQFSTRYNFK